jgi:hypothetical protein
MQREPLGPQDFPVWTVTDRHGRACPVPDCKAQSVLKAGEDVARICPSKFSSVTATQVHGVGDDEGLGLHGLVINLAVVWTSIDGHSPASERCTPSPTPCSVAVVVVLVKTAGGQDHWEIDPVGDHMIEPHYLLADRAARNPALSLAMESDVEFCAQGVGEVQGDSGLTLLGAVVPSLVSNLLGNSVEVD